MPRFHLPSVLLFVVTLPVLGQGVPSDTTVLEDLVVTATRSERPRRLVPATVSVVSGTELRARGFRFVGDWLREVPGVAVVPTGSFGGVTSLFLRGGESDYTKVLIDGVPANLPGGSVDFSNFSTENVERIEVLRGPASVLYGSDAMTGVIQIFTRRGSGRRSLSAAARAGTKGTSDLRVMHQGAAQGTTWSTSLSRFGSDGFFDFNNRYRSAVGSLRLATTLGEWTDAGLVVRYGDHRAHFPTDFSGVPTDSNQFNAEQALTVGLEIERRLGRGVEVRISGSAYRGDFGFSDEPDGPADTVGFGYAGDRESLVQRQLVDARLLLAMNERVDLSVGLELGRESEEQISSTFSNFGDGAFSDDHRFNADRSHRAVYAQARAALAQALDLHLGARQDDNEVFGSFTTWKAGMVALPSTALRFHATVGRAFKQPTFSEQFARTPFEVGNPDLRPERGLSWELGAEWAIGSTGASVTATWFDQRFKDRIEYLPADPGEPTYQNLASAVASGLEAGVSWRAATGLSAGAAWTWLRTRVEGMEERLLRRPTHQASARVSWGNSAAARIGAEFLWVGTRDDTDFRVFPAERVALDAYSLVNLTADVPLGVIERWSLGDLTATLRVDNLLDTAYETVVGFPGRGRLLLMGLRFGQ